MDEDGRHAAGEQRLLLAASPTSYSTTIKDHLPKKQHHNLAGVSPLRFRLICLAAWSCTFLGSLDSTIVATVLTDIGSSFNASNQAQWLGTAYLLSLCCFTPVYGRLSDLIGRRAAHLTGLSCFLLGTAMCGVAPSMGFLIAARCIAGIGGGGIQSVGSIIITDLVDLRRRGLYQVRSSAVEKMELILIRGTRTSCLGRSPMFPIYLPGQAWRRTRWTTRRLDIRLFWMAPRFFDSSASAHYRWPPHLHASEDPPA